MVPLLETAKRRTSSVNRPKLRTGSGNSEHSSVNRPKLRMWSSVSWGSSVKTRIIRMRQVNSCHPSVKRPESRTAIPESINPFANNGRLSRRETGSRYMTTSHKVNLKFRQQDITSTMSPSQKAHIHGLSRIRTVTDTNGQPTASTSSGAGFLLTPILSRQTQRPVSSLS